MKTCCKCKEEKSNKEFWRDKTKKDGLQTQCKECQREYNRCWREVNPEKVRENSRRWQEANSEEKKEYQRRYCEESRFVRALTMSRAHAKISGYLPCSATPKELEAVFIGHCHACDLSEADNGRRLEIDHDHNTGEFRGWLCHVCNVRDVLAIA